MMMEGHMAQRKVPSCIPHDIGDPGDPLILWVSLLYVNSELLASSVSRRVPTSLFMWNDGTRGCT